MPVVVTSARSAFTMLLTSAQSCFCASEQFRASEQFQFHDCTPLHAPQPAIARRSSSEPSVDLAAALAEASVWMRTGGSNADSPAAAAAAPLATGSATPGKPSSARPSASDPSLRANSFKDFTWDLQPIRTSPGGSRPSVPRLDRSPARPTGGSGKSSDDAVAAPAAGAAGDDASAAGTQAGAAADGHAAPAQQAGQMELTAEPAAEPVQKQSTGAPRFWAPPGMELATALSMIDETQEKAGPSSRKGGGGGEAEEAQLRRLQPRRLVGGAPRKSSDAQVGTLTAISWPTFPQEILSHCSWPVKVDSIDGATAVDGAADCDKRSTSDLGCFSAVSRCHSLLCHPCGVHRKHHRGGVAGEGE